MSRIGANSSGSTSSGSGNVTGIPPTKFDSMTRWADTVGQTIKDSNTLIQDSGAVQTQMFIFKRDITNDVTIPDGYRAVSSDIQLTTGDLILDGDATLILV